MNVKLGLQAITQESDEALRQAVTEHLTSEVTRMEKMVQNLLDYSRADHAKPVSTRLGAVVHQAVADYPAPGNVEVEVRVLWNEPISLDPEQQLKAIGALLDNAYRAVAQGGRVVLSLERDGEAVKLCVQDSGEGIEPAQREQVFEPGHTNWRQGLGLGLAFCRRVAQNHGGTIEAGSSAELGGAQLDLHYPLN